MCVCVWVRERERESARFKTVRMDALQVCCLEVCEVAHAQRKCDFNNLESYLGGRSFKIAFPPCACYTAKRLATCLHCVSMPTLIRVYFIKYMLQYPSPVHHYIKTCLMSTQCKCNLILFRFFRVRTDRRMFGTVLHRFRYKSVNVMHIVPVSLKHLVNHKMYVKCTAHTICQHLVCNVCSKHFSLR
jgi:hypothetical protein